MVMIDLQQLKILAQLIDNMEVVTNVLEEAYNRTMQRISTKPRMNYWTFSLKFQKFLS